MIDCAGVTTVHRSKFLSKQLTLSGVSTFFGNIDADGDLDVDGHAELDQLNVTGVSTFAGITTVTIKFLHETNECFWCLYIRRGYYFLC